MKRALRTAVLAAPFVVLVAGDAWAVPAFARKYQTSCQTCHTAYPKLNPFGNAFRMRGYRMPAETEEMVKETPVSLGVEAYKRVWPDAVWPSDIPGTVPLAVDVRLSSVTSHDAEHDETVKSDFRFPESVALLGAGTLGETLSFLTEIEAENEPADEHGEGGVALEVAHAELRFNGLWGTGPAFNLKVGRMTPEMTQTFSHGYLLTDSLPAAMFGFNPIGFHGSSEVGGLGHAGGHGGGGGGIALPAGVDAIEVYGIAAHRLDYSAGIANGIGPGVGSMDGNNSKDFFGRVGYKFGGLSLDGEEYEPSDKGWRENSIRVGAFGYRGEGDGILFAGSGHHGGSFAMDEEFTRLGFDVNVYLRDLNVIAGFVRGRDRLAVFETHVEDEHGEADEHAEEEDEHAEEGEGDLVLEDVGDFTYKAWFVEADYVFYPWLHGGFRYEWLDPSDTRRPAFERVTVNVSVLVRANVKAFLEYQRNTGGGDRDDYLLRGVLRFAY
jgi:hypothetical protein